LNILFVTIVEIHTLYLDVCVCLKDFYLSEQCLRYQLVYFEKSGSNVIESLWCFYDHYTFKSESRL